MRLLAISVFVIAIGVSDAFTVNRAPFVSGQGCDRLTQMQLAKQESEFMKHVVKTMGALSLGSVLAFNVVDSSATAYVQPPDASMSESLAKNDVGLTLMVSRY